MILAAPAAWAQTTGSATLRGVVKDANGDIIPDANVSLTSDKTGYTRTSHSTSEGVYVFAQIEPDVYTLKVEKEGFNTQVVTEISVSPSDTRGQDVTLEVGLAGNTTTVTAEPEVITDTGEKAHTITASQIQNISLIGRSSLELLRTLPGVVAPEQQSQLQTTGFNTGGNANNAYAVNGLRGTNNNVSIDGSRVIDVGSNNGTIVTANNDFVQEVKVQVSNYAAEYGSSAVQITAVTKSGGKDFHGSLYDYWRPWQVSANDRSRTTVGLDRPHDRYQYPGGTFSGPIILPWTDFNKNRDKAFFFVGLEFQRQFVSSDTRFAVVPTLKQRQGDFSEFLNGPFLGQTYGAVHVPGGYDNAGQPIANGDLSPYIDSIGQALINLYPQPTGLYGNGRYNYATAAPSNVPRTDWKMRFDYRFNDKTSMFVRWARETEQLDYPYGVWWQASNYELPSPITGTNLGRSLAVSVTSVLSPTTVNEVVFSGSRLKLDNDYQDPSKVSRSALGLEGFTLPFGTISDQAPLYLESGSGLGNLWSPGVLPIFAYNDSFSITDNLSKLVGAHNMKFGGLIEQANKTQNQSDSATGHVQLASWGNGTTTSDFGDLLVGRPAGLTQTTQSAVGHFRFYNYEGYAQDSWKVRSNFTLEYGARVSYFPNNFERNSLGVVFSPDAYVRGAGPYINGDPLRPNGVLTAASGAIPKRINDNPPIKIAPRAGFAWDIRGTSDTVVRGGAGVFYNRVQGNYQYGSITAAPNEFSFAANSYNYTNLSYSNFGNIDPFTAVDSFSPNSQNPNGEQIPRIVTLSLSVSQRLPYDNVLEVAYVGTQGRHLAQQVAANELLPGTLDFITDPVERSVYNSALVNQYRQFPDFGGVTFQDWSGTSSYHSLQATLSRQLGQKVQYYLTYTFSKALGTLATNETGTTLSPINTRGRQYGILPFDRTHIFNSTYILQLPEGARGMFDNAVARQALNGWKVSGITTFQSGIPLALSIAGDYNSDPQRLGYFGTNNGGTALNYIANPITGFDEIGQHIVDASALSIPGFGEEGTYISPYYLRAPSRWNSDVTLFKTFGITESQNIEFRVGFFNIFNQAYANPNIAGDIQLSVQTACNRRVSGISDGNGGTVDNVCDPTGGYTITNPKDIGLISNKHGHRIIEFALKYNF